MSVRGYADSIKELKGSLRRRRLMIQALPDAVYKRTVELPWYTVTVVKTELLPKSLQEQFAMPEPPDSPASLPACLQITEEELIAALKVGLFSLLL